MRSGYERKLIGGIVLTGGGAQLKHIKQLVEYITGLDCRIGKPIEHVINYTDESQLPPALSTGVGLVITGEENVGEDYFERVLGEEVAKAEEEEVVTPVDVNVPAEAAVADDFMSFMNSIGVAGSEEEEKAESTVANTENEENKPSMADQTQEETEEKAAPVLKERKVRKPFGESIVGRFKGFFENDEAVN
jgi:cell division ATPase FtsA